MLKSIFMKISMCIVATEPISTAYSKNPYQQSVSVCVCLLPILRNGSVKFINRFRARQRSVNIFPQHRIHGTLEEMLEASFLCGLCLIKGKSVGKDVPAATKNCWRRGFLCGSSRINEK
jgi:hypothetical protein